MHSYKFISGLLFFFYAKYVKHLININNFYILKLRIIINIISIKYGTIYVHMLVLVLFFFFPLSVYANTILWKGSVRLLVDRHTYKIHYGN